MSKTRGMPHCRRGSRWQRCSCCPCRLVAEESFKSGVAALALWSDPVFSSEARGAAKVLAARYGHGGPVIVRANSAAKLVAGPDGIAGLWPPRGAGSIRTVTCCSWFSPRMGRPTASPRKAAAGPGWCRRDELARLLAASPIRHKVLVVSACYAGTYAALADPDTLVITAADATHPSFGCVPGAVWTYFGDAFFNQALRRDASITQAFADARSIVSARENAQGFAPSNPQMGGGENVLPMLEACALTASLAFHGGPETII